MSRRDPTSRLVRLIVTLGGLALAAYLFACLFRHADAGATWGAITAAGPLAAVALVPFLFGMTFDALGSVALLRALGNRTTLAQMLPVRIASEAIHLSIPAGFVASDTASALLLEARADVALRDGVVATIARKWLVMRAHAAYIVVGAVVGFPALAALSRRLMGNDALAWCVFGSAIVPLVGSWALGAGLLGRSAFERLRSLLVRLPSRRASRWLETRRGAASATDAQAARLRCDARASMTASALFLACWATEALESAVLARLVGVDVSLSGVVAVEAALSLVRSIAVIAPSGLGVVDLGYATVLPLLGADPSSAAAFVLLKRAKELSWVAVGYAVLAAMRARGRSRMFANARVSSAA